MNSTKSLRMLALAWGLALAGSVLTPASLGAESGPCATVNGALDRAFAGPTHIFNKQLAPRELESETISVGGKMYVHLKGQWRLSPLTAAALAAQRKENLSHSTMSCRAVGEESVGGSAATVYEAKGKTEMGYSETKVWIAKGSGLLLKDEESITEGKDVVLRRAAHYEYTGVHAPI